MLCGDTPPTHIVLARQLVVQTSRSAVQRLQVGRPAPQSPQPGTPRLPRRGSVVIPAGMAISHRRLWRSLALVYKRAWSASFALRRAFIFNAAANGVAGYAAAQLILLWIVNHPGAMAKEQADANWCGNISGRPWERGCPSRYYCLAIARRRSV